MHLIPFQTNEEESCVFERVRTVEEVHDVRRNGVCDLLLAIPSVFLAQESLVVPGDEDSDRET